MRGFKPRQGARAAASKVRGPHLQAKGDAKSALPHYKRAVELDPEWLEAVFGVAKSYHDLSMWEDAVLNYRKVLRMDPAIPDAYFGLSRIYEELGSPSQAIGLLRQGLTYAPDDTAATRRLGELTQAQKSQ